MADSPNTTHSDWLKFFLPEGRACVARRQQLGDYISDPDGAARVYASFAAFDAHMKGPAFQAISYGRAFEIAAYMAGVRPQAERIAA